MKAALLPSDHLSSPNTNLRIILADRYRLGGPPGSSKTSRADFTDGLILAGFATAMIAVSPSPR